MNNKTINYLSSRFSDYYRKNPPDLPPQHEQRELGYIIWEEQVMKRHISTRNINNFKMFLSDSKPRHLYLTSALFDTPQAANMSQKGWKGANLIFDIDDKEVPSINDDDNYGVKMEKAKKEVQKLLSFIKDDFGFEDYRINFSGSQGFHLRVHDEEALNLTSKQREEIADYISLSKGDDLNLEDLLINAVNLNYEPNIKRFHISGGWSKRFYQDVNSYFDSLVEKDKDDQIDQLTQYEGLGKTRAERITEKLDHILDLLKWGAVDTSDGIDIILEEILEETKKQKSNIDRPVTTDTKRLIRLINSLHGGSGLKVKEVKEENLDDFDPTVEAIPELFKKRKTKIKISEPTEIYRNGETHYFKEGTQKVPEYIAISLMCEEKAEKA